MAWASFVEKGEYIPNWCNNNLTIKGPYKELERFKKFAKGNGKNELISANNFIPYPEKFKELDEYAESKEAKEMELKTNKSIKDGYNSGGYEWCIKNWGTKWDFDDVELAYDSDNELDYVFDTAWSPPGPVVEKMGKLFPELTFKLKYSEEGVGFKGELKVQNGKVVDYISKSIGRKKIKA